LDCCAIGGLDADIADRANRNVQHPVAESEVARAMPARGERRDKCPSPRHRLKGCGGEGVGISLYGIPRLSGVTIVRTCWPLL
jgi:hypothetical protein